VTGDASLVAGVVVLSVETGGGSTLTGDAEVVGSVDWIACASTGVEESARAAAIAGRAPVRP
jgi:hypothetical protein